MTSGEATAENRWYLAYGPIGELPTDDADLWVDHRLEVAESVTPFEWLADGIDNFVED
ncbi:MAG: hypothetical protein BMS9Abin37_1687 [Acidobacteriota bacterium]|nr:MAG: hypothetical protein BMS9Abin37_1687 [Acidobacteriota bacterium]